MRNPETYIPVTIVGPLDSAGNVKTSGATAAGKRVFKYKQERFTAPNTGDPVADFLVFLNTEGAKGWEYIEQNHINSPFPQAIGRTVYFKMLVIE